MPWTGMTEAWSTAIHWNPSRTARDHQEYLVILGSAQKRKDQAEIPEEYLVIVQGCHSTYFFFFAGPRPPRWWTTACEQFIVGRN